jgi:hypothetical protein
MDNITPETLALMDDFKAKLAVHKAALEAKKKADEAESLASNDLAASKAKLNAAIWQDLEPMPLVPAPREGTNSLIRSLIRKNVDFGMFDYQRG